MLNKEAGLWRMDDARRMPNMPSLYQEIFAAYTLIGYSDRIGDPCHTRIAIPTQRNIHPASTVSALPDWTHT